MKKVLIAFLGFSLLLLVACGDKAEEEEVELAILDVTFNVPETAEVDETVELEAVVTYGGEIVEDADEVKFEYWLVGNEDNSVDIEGVHTENGSYVAEVSFPEDGVYEMYAHTTAEGLHTMPLTSITIGDGGESIVEDDAEEVHDTSKGFHSHFINADNIAVDQETVLIVHLQLDGEPLAEVDVRYEIVPEDNPEGAAWIDVVETSPAEFKASHTFTEVGTYKVVVHVEDDADLHEHEEYTLTVE